jgi:hypothetical protein
MLERWGALHAGRSALGLMATLIFLWLSGELPMGEGLRTKGVDIVWGPRVRETYSRAEICDPNGYHVELRQWFG